MPIGKPTAQTEASRRYQKKAGLIAKSYKLKRELAEEFAEACDKAGVAQSRQIANMMQAFIDEQNKQ